LDWRRAIGVCEDLMVTSLRGIPRRVWHRVGQFLIIWGDGAPNWTVPVGSGSPGDSGARFDRFQSPVERRRSLKIEPPKKMVASF
jgi:hypothetical protein